MGYIKTSLRTRPCGDLASARCGNVQRRARCFFGPRDSKTGAVTEVTYCRLAEPTYLSGQKGRIDARSLLGEYAVRGDALQETCCVLAVHRYQSPVRKFRGLVSCRAVRLGRPSASDLAGWSGEERVSVCVGCYAIMS